MSHDYNPAYDDHDQDNAPEMPDTFRDWLKQTLDADQLRDLAQYGANTGWPGLTYTRDNAALFDRYEDEIWNYAAELADDIGHPNVWALVAESRNAPATVDQLKEWFVWAMAEGVAEELADELDEEAEEEAEEEEEEETE